MRTLTAYQVSRHFLAVLDDVEAGETVVITRGGRKLAMLAPMLASNGAAATTALSQLPDDDSYWDAVEAAREAVARSWHVT